jgi:hypothetical protein
MVYYNTGTIATTILKNIILYIGGHSSFNVMIGS